MGEQPGRGEGDWSAITEYFTGEERAGYSKPQDVLVRYVGKRDRPDWKRPLPRQVANDYIGSEIARIIGLPVPACAIHRAADGVNYFISHWQEAVSGPEASRLEPPQSIERVFAYLAADRHAAMRHGIVVADVFLANNDRNAGNLMLGREDQLFVIDFGNALLYRPRKNRRGEAVPYGLSRLAAVCNDPLAMWDIETPYGLASGPFIARLIDDWCERIATLPLAVVEAVVGRVPRENLTEAEAGGILEFLDVRRKQLRAIIEETVVEVWGLEPRS